MLILAYDFPPYTSVAALRPYSWFRYLAEFGIEPIVVTRQWGHVHGDWRDYVAPSSTMSREVERTDRGTIIRTPYRPNLAARLLLAHGPDKYRLVRKLITAWSEVWQYILPVGPKRQLFRAARSWLATESVHVIIATGEPFVLFRYASWLSREFGLPWVADYRDPWSQDKRRHPVQRLWEAQFERRIVPSAAAILTVSPFNQDALREIAPRRVADVVPNGYDPDAIAAAANVAQESERLTIAFAGSTYGYYPVESVFSVFEDFLMRHGFDGLALLLIGVENRATLEELMQKKFPRLAKAVTFVGRLSNSLMAAEMARANAFLLFNTYAFSGTKVYDFSALCRKILLCYSDDPDARHLKDLHYNVDTAPGTDDRVLEKMITDTRSGVVVKDAAHLRSVLEDLRIEFERHRRIYCEPVGIEKYSRRERARELAQVLRRVTRAA